MSDPQQPEEFITSNSIQTLLAAILFSPHGDHASAISQHFQLPLLNGHVATIYRILKKGARKAFPNSFTNDVGVALHCILSHLLGCNKRTMPKGLIDREFVLRCNQGRKVAIKHEAEYFSLQRHAKAAAKQGNSESLTTLRASRFNPTSHPNLGYKADAANETHSNPEADRAPPLYIVLRERA